MEFSIPLTQFLLLLMPDITMVHFSFLDFVQLFIYLRERVGEQGEGQRGRERKRESLSAVQLGPSPRDPEIMI